MTYRTPSLPVLTVGVHWLEQSSILRDIKSVSAMMMQISGETEMKFLLPDWTSCLASRILVTKILEPESNPFVVVGKHSSPSLLVPHAISLFPRTRIMFDMSSFDYWSRKGTVSHVNDVHEKAGRSHSQFSHVISWGGDANDVSADDLFGVQSGTHQSNLVQVHLHTYSCSFSLYERRKGEDLRSLRSKRAS